MIEICDKSLFSINDDAQHAEVHRWNVFQWYVLYARSRHEKTLRDELTRKKVEVFLPTRKITRQWSDRKKTVEEPLFPGYLFARFPLKNRWDVLNTGGAIRLVGKSNAEPTAVDERDIASIDKFMRQDLEVDPYPYLKEGERVYVRSGPLRGVEGFIVRKDAHCRLVVSVDLIMKSISVAIDSGSVERI